MSAIDWSSPDAKVTEHFTVYDALQLHQWKRLATTSDGVDYGNIEKICRKMEEVRSFLGVPINAHCTYRSPAYNKLCGAPEHDVHSMSLAMDFDCNDHMTIEEVKAKLEPELERLGIRMERGTTSWVHLDIHTVGHARYFYP
jgi:uncharacterized protein YcbK (DUF882 family)